MNEMNSLCQEMQDRLNLANDKTVTLLEQTDALREQRYDSLFQEGIAKHIYAVKCTQTTDLDALLFFQLNNTISNICAVRQTILEAFLDRFTLSESEITILCSTAMDVTPAFFDALEHLENIHADCNALLITEHQRAGYVHS